MGLRLQTVPAAQGLQWVRMGLVECFRHPLGYASLFLMFMSLALMLSVLPWLGGLLTLMTVPLLSLAFVMATSASQRGLPVHVGVYMAPWRGTAAPRRRALVQLCLAYGMATLAALALCDLIDGGTFEASLAQLASGKASGAEVPVLLGAPELLAGAAARTAASALLSLPFWHAPALVQWSGQGPAQALFSSLIAVWRTRWALLLYALGWFLALGGAGTLGTLLLASLGLGSWAALVMMPLALFFTTAFYASLYFCFVDSFGASEP